MSGGGYIAASRALVAHDLKDHPVEGGPAYAPGSLEERNLRNNTHYIAPDGATLLVGLLSLFLGVIVTALLVFAPLYAIAHAWGWLLHAQGALTASKPALQLSVAAWMWLVPLVAGSITLALFIWWWWTLAPRRRGGPVRLFALPTLGDPDRGSGNARWVGWASFITAALAVATLVLPAAASWLFSSGGAFGTVVHFFGFGHHMELSWAALSGLAAAIAAIAKSCQAGLDKWNKLASQKAAGGTGAAADAGIMARVITLLRQRLLPWLASVVIVLLAAFVTVAWVGDGAMAGMTARQLWLALAAVIVMVLARVVADVNRMSMHDFYRWRLANAYAVTRGAIREHDPAKRREKFTAATGALLSSLSGAPEDKPSVVLCATANINASREAPPGQNAFCVTFEPDFVTLHRERGSAEPEPVRAATTDYETLVGRDRFTLFDVSAISGAAVAPLMGSATRCAYRILFTVANVRLGVWGPHPKVVKAAAAKAGSGQPPDSTSRALLLLLWYLSPHPFWNRNPGRNEDREARLWAHVLRVRHRTRWGQRVRAALWYRALQPTLGMLWAEAAGHTSYRSTWLCLSDGGHYDNLGLVQALRRPEVRHILILDASGDKAHSWSTLGGAMALARTEAGMEINLDPSSMVSDHGRTPPSLDPGEVVRPWAHGTFSRIGGQHPIPDGEIWVCKLGWWKGAPWDVRSYAAGHAEFPCRPTSDQLYDGAEFEAYRALGSAAVTAAAAEGSLFPA